MSPGPQHHDVQYFPTSDALRAWFDANHASADELWLGYYKKGSGRPSIAWSEAVDEALCVGWIDGIARSLDGDRYVQRFTSRRKGSNWSAINVAKVAALTAAGRMRPTGMAAFEARTPERTAIYSYERDPVAFTDEETASFKANPAAWADWERRPPSYRTPATHWVTSAKRAETRARRLATLIEDSAAGRRVAHLAVGRER